jgi:hypothetical protein
MMTRPEPRTILAAIAFAVATVCLPALAPTAAASAPPFCVLRGGGGEAGATAPQICAYHDYQACLQAAAERRGNCVQNIDYHGGTAPAPAARRSHRAR